MKRPLLKSVAVLLAAILLLGGCADQNRNDDPAAGEAEQNRTRYEDALAEESKASPAEGGAEANAAGTETDAAAESELKAALDPISERFGAMGVQAAVIKNGEVFACYEYGYADREAEKMVSRDTKFRCASLSKLCIAMVTAVLVDEGQMGWDSDVGDLLGYSVRNPAWPETAITPRMLLTHTSSIVDSGAFLDSRNDHSSAQLSSLLSSGASFSGSKPGSAYSYSNFGVAVLAAAEEKLTGMPFHTLAKEKLFIPLNMDAAFLASELKDRAALAPLYTSGSVSYSTERQLQESASDVLGQTHHLYQGNLTVSAADYAKFIVTLLGDGAMNGRRIISREAVKEITGAQFDVGTVADGVQGFGECQLMNLVGGRTMHCHTGSNFGMFACFAFDKAGKSGIVILTSGANAVMNHDSGVYDIHTDMIRAVYDTILA